MHCSLTALVALMMTSASLAVATADVNDHDWPTFRHDAGRSGSTDAVLKLPLKLHWHVAGTVPPQPAWPAPASGNIYQRMTYLHPSETADKAPHVVTSGDRCWYASSATDTVYCRRLGTGELLWAHTTSAPVRLPPSVAGGRVYAASDDGLVHCLDVDGRVLWKRRIGPEDRWLPGNSRLISRWPVRAGPLVKDGRVYVAAGVFPTDGVFLACLEAATGKVIWQHAIDMAASGPLLANADSLIVQALRSQPNVFELATGKPVGQVAGGGQLAVVWKSQLVSGPSEIGKVTGVDNALLATLPDRHQFQFVARDDGLYAASQQMIVAVGPDLRVRWKQPRKSSHSLIAAGDLVIAGGEGEVAAYRISDGNAAWQAAIEGKALGLAVAGGNLLVSTDQGQVYCFGAEKEAPANAPKIADVPKSLPTISPPALELVAVLGGAGLAPDGYALFIEPPSHEDLFGLIRQSTLRVVGVYRDPKQAAEAREALRKVGLVGARGTAIAQPETWNALPAQAFNLVLAYAHPQADPPPIESWKLLLQPYNGIMAIVGARNAKLIDGAEVKRIETKLPAGGEASMNIWRAKPAAGLGEWSHPYADPGNSACSGDAVVKGPFEIAWFGPPGPENMVDRHNRTSPPLFRAGRLFVPGLDRITAVDAFNGTVLWQRPLPGATRLAVSKNTGHVVAGPKEVFVVRQAECVALDAATGKVVRTLRVPAPVAADKEWGYLALCDDVLLGSVSQSEESRRKLTQTSWEQGYLDHQPLVVSERLFALRPNSGSTAWQYQPKGAVVNTAVAAGDGHVYFVESADPATLKNSGRVHLGKLLEKGAHLVALRLDTGHEAWRVPLELKTRHILFLTLAGKKLVLAGSHNEGADLVSDVQAHDSADGRKLWALAQSTGMKVGGSHGEQEQHPLVVGDTLFFKTFSCDLARGSVRKNWKLPVVGCGALSASLHSAFYRAGTACYAELGESVNQQLTGVTRPGCWLNMLPTGGLVLAPESSAGCTCAQYSVQTSLALRPLAAPPPDVLAGFGTGAMERLQGDIEYAGRLRVALAAPQPADRIVYSLDGTWPGKQSASYDKPLTVDRPATLFARTYRGDQPGGITRRNLRCVTVPRLTGLTTTIVTSAKLEFARYPGEAVIRYQLDGKSPTTQSPTYDKLVTLTETTQVRAAYFDGDTKLGEDLAVEFRKVPGRKPDTPAAVQPGLAYEYFEVDGLKKLPDMDRLKPVRTGVTDRLAIPAPHRADNFAVRFRGYLEIAADGLYSFRLISDDGSEVCIGDEVLISHDGVHDARSERRATIPLAAGKHRIEIRYFEGDGNELLLVRYGLPGADKNELPAGALWHEANPR